MENKLFDLKAEQAERVYIKGALPGVEVGMKRVNLQNGETVLLYDTSGVYAEEGFETTVAEGIPKRFLTIFLLRIPIVFCIISIVG